MIIKLVKKQLLRFEEIIVVIKLKFSNGENNILSFLNNNNILFGFCFLCALVGDYCAMRFLKYVYNNLNSNKVFKNIRKTIKEIYLVLKKIGYELAGEIKNTIDEVKNKFFMSKVFKQISNLIYYFKRFNQPIQSIKQSFFKLFKKSKLREKIGTFTTLILKILAFKQYIIIMTKEILGLSRQLKSILRGSTNLNKIIELLYEFISKNFIFRFIAAIWMYIILGSAFFIIFFLMGIYKREKNMLKLLLFLQLLELHKDYDEDRCTKIFAQKTTQPDLFIPPRNNQINKPHLKLNESTENFNNQSDEITLPQFLLKNISLTEDSNYDTVVVDNPIIDIHYFRTPTSNTFENEIELVKMFKFTLNEDIELES